MRTDLLKSVLGYCECDILRICLSLGKIIYESKVVMGDLISETRFCAMYTGQKGLGPGNLNLRKVNTFSRNVDVRTQLAFFVIRTLKY